jgi:hypothetical protein
MVVVSVELHVEQPASVSNQLGVFLGNLIGHDDWGGHWASSLVAQGKHHRGKLTSV